MQTLELNAFSFASQQSFLPPMPSLHTDGGLLVKILLISSDASLRKHMPVALEDWQFAVETTDERSGNRRARMAKHDAIVLDIESAHDDKIGWIAEWRQRGLMSKVLVLLEPSIRAEDRIRCLNLGADDFLMKPFKDDELQARLWAFLRARKHPSSEAYRIHDLEIDPVSLSVRRDGRLIQCTPREFDVLQLLIENRGKVVKRSMILQHLYPHATADERHSNVVDVYVSYLRKKIDDGARNRLILTRWGQGYEFLGDDGSA